MSTRHPTGQRPLRVRNFVELGGRIHEHSEADEFCDDPRGVKANGYTVNCEDVVLATHNPLVGLGGFAGATLFRTKLALYTSYVIAGRVSRGAVPDACGGTQPTTPGLASSRTGATTW